MKILPIQNTRLSVYKTNQTTNATSFPTITSPLQADTIAFGRTAQNAEKLRELFKYGMIDIYTGKPLIDPDFLTKLLQEKSFSGPIKSVIKVLEPIEECLHPVEKAVLKKIKNFSKRHPYYELADVMKKLAPQAQEKLINIQTPIFKKLEKLAKNMPKEQKEAFDELMQKTYDQLSSKPIQYKFSNKEFKYKLTRIRDAIKQRKIQDEIQIMKKLERMAEQLPYSPSGRNFVRRRPKLNLNRSMQQADIIMKMNNFWERSCLKNDKELRDLFTNAKRQILNIPTVIPFQRRSFIHELSAITNTLDDRQLAKELEKKACELPTSQKEVAAFISKSSRNSSEKIGHDLLIGSIATIEHIVPFSDKKGEMDFVENYVFASTQMNSNRGNKPFAQWVRETPSVYEGAQKMIDKIILLKRVGILKQESFWNGYINNIVQRIQKLSPPEKPIIIDISRLKR